MLCYEIRDTDRYLNSKEEQILEQDKNIIIIGSGIGGSGIAALLAKDGAKPIVFERNAFIGGKAGSYDFKGCKIEHGIHISARGQKGPLGALAKQVGANVRFIERNPTMRLIYGGRQGLIRQNMIHPGIVVCNESHHQCPAEIFSRCLAFWNACEQHKNKEGCRTVLWRYGQVNHR